MEKKSSIKSQTHPVSNKWQIRKHIQNEIKFWTQNEFNIKPKTDAETNPHNPEQIKI